MDAMARCHGLANGSDEFSVSPMQTCGLSTSGVQFCCSVEDTCLEDSICHYNHTLFAPGRSGYYIGLCTDSSVSKPCSKSCSKSYSRLTSRYGSGVMYGILTLTPFSTADLSSQDIVFTDSFNSLWACCHHQPGDTLDCSSM